MKAQRLLSSKPVQQQPQLGQTHLRHRRLILRPVKRPFQTLGREQKTAPVPEQTADAVAAAITEPEPANTSSRSTLLTGPRRPSIPSRPSVTPVFSNTRVCSLSHLRLGDRQEAVNEIGHHFERLTLLFDHSYRHHVGPPNIPVLLSRSIAVKGSRKSRCAPASKGRLARLTVSARSRARRTATVSPSTLARSSWHPSLVRAFPRDVLAINASRADGPTGDNDAARAVRSLAPNGFMGFRLTRVGAVDFRSLRG
jgi:hypothetical protein